MKLTKFGKVLLMSALSTVLIPSVTSCVSSYAVGYLYVTGTVTAGTSANGIVSGFSIDHNTGKLTPLHGLPVSSGGANPVRAILVNGSRFLYVLNRGASADGQPCTTIDPCLNSNITLFAVGGNGILTQQEQFFTQGINPFRLVADSSGSHLYVLDHDSSSSNGLPSTQANPNPNCGLALAGATTCGDITAFSINSATGRLSIVQNTQADANGVLLNYFPVPSNPVDILYTLSNVLTLFSATSSNTYPYSGGGYIFPYAYQGGSGVLSVDQQSAQTLNISEGNALVQAGSLVYALDNEPITADGVSSNSQILQYSIASSGALQPQNGGTVPDDPAQSNPIFLTIEARGKWLYVANQGTLTNQSGTGLSGITGYIIDPTTHQLSEIPGLPFTTGAGPQCLVEDPSNQFFYSANLLDSSVSGNSVDQNSGSLRPLSSSHNVPDTYTLAGPATWCLVDGRTS